MGPKYHENAQGQTFFTRFTLKLLLATLAMELNN